MSPGQQLWIREQVLRDTIAEVARLSGQSFDAVEDSLGIGCLEVVDLTGCERSIERLRPQLEKLRRDNPPRVSGTAWRRLSLCDRVPELAACYAIFGDRSLVYVGSTENLAVRMKGHGMRVSRYSHTIETPWGNFANVSIKYRATLKYGDWAMVELRLIRRLQPVGNIRGILKAARKAI